MKKPRRSETTNFLLLVVESSLAYARSIANRQQADRCEAINIASAFMAIYLNLSRGVPITLSARDQKLIEAVVADTIEYLRQPLAQWHANYDLTAAVSAQQGELSPPTTSVAFVPMMAR